MRKMCPEVAAVTSPGEVLEIQDATAVSTNHRTQLCMEPARSPGDCNARESLSGTAFISALLLADEEFWRDIDL